MNKKEIIKKLDKEIKNLQALKDELVNEDLKINGSEKIKKHNEMLQQAEEETRGIIKDLLAINGLPNDEEFLESVYKVCYRKNIYVEQLSTILNKVAKANAKSPKDDIRKYVFTCLHNANN